MKKHLLTIMAVLAMCAPFITSAQNGNAASSFSINNISIEVTNVQSISATSCRVNMNLNFVAVLASTGNGNNNSNGNAQKFLTLHLWNSSSYPKSGINYTVGSSAPSKSALGNVLSTVVLERSGNSQWQISNVYGHKNSTNVAVTTTGLQVVAIEFPENLGGLENYLRNYAYFQIRGLSVIVPTAAANFTPAQLTADVWGSRGGQNNDVIRASRQVSLFQCNVGNSTANVPTFEGIIGNCSSASSTYSVSFSNAGNCRPFFVDYKLYVDLNDDGDRDNGEPQINSGDNDGDGLYDNVAVLLPGQTILTTPQRPATGVGTHNLIVEGTLSTVNINVVNGQPTVIESAITLDAEPISNPCLVLPVKFKSFSAVRNSRNAQQVDLIWETAQEENNKGFHVQRKTGNEWKTVAFVFSAASNSTETQRYAFKDLNNFEGISQYRLLQEDLSGTGTYSDVKVVHGREQAASVIVYPNPAVNGIVNLLFANVGSREVIVNDLSGRVVKSFREVTQNNLTIEGLSGGFYTIKIVDRKTAQMTVTKVVVK